jgi:hypothetical protein
VLGILITLLMTAAVVYVDNFLLDKYMRTLAEQPGLTDAALSDRILRRARQLNLPVAANDVTVTRAEGRPHVRIGKYSVQTYLGRMDLRLPEAASR